MDKAKILAGQLKIGLKEHEIMRDHTTLRAGGVADFYFEAHTATDLIKAVKAAHRAQLPYFILGNGSNILFSDFGFPGLVIKNATANIAFMMEKSQVIVDSGMSLQKLILESISHDLAGLEFLYGIPGTVGGALYGNAGAYGQSIGDYAKFVTLLLPGEKDQEPQIVQYRADWLEFKYRSTKLKKIKGYQKPIILSVRFQLAQSKKEEIMRRLKQWNDRRAQTQPAGQSAGCIFKNPIPAVLENVSGTGSRNMPELPKERTAGFLLDKAGAKKMKVGQARVSDRHANFIINTDSAKAQEIRKLIEEMRAAVKNKFNITLEEEIEYAGQW